MNDLQQGEFPIESENDIVSARRLVRNAAVAAGFGLTDVTRIVTAASELTRNIYVHAKSGVMRWRFLKSESKVGLELTFEDSGLGIPNVAKAMEAGYSTGNGLGMGLPGAKRLTDEMTVHSEVGKGTTVVVRKWLTK
jgi:serine/threonine-protein kinase RsbT